MYDEYVGTAQGRYQSCSINREIFLERARDSSELTLPTLIPPKSASNVTRYPTPYQGIGARGVNNLASKLLLALLPPNSPFFRMKIDDYVIKELEGEQKLKTEIESGLSQIERAIMTDIELNADRVAVFEAIKHLIVAGNVLLYVGEEGLRVFSLERFVCKRDPMGHVLEIITKENISPSSLPKEIVEAVKARLDSDEKTVELYTYVCKEKTKWSVYQEVKGIELPKSRGTFPLDASPYIPLRWNRVDGEDYGRGFVEEYYGDLKSLEGLTKAIVEGSAAASKVLFMVSPNGTTRARKLAESPNGAIIEGSANDVSVLQLNKFADFRIAYDAMRGIEQRLQLAFLLNASVQRDAERVTAEEIRYMAQELEDTLGGVYSILSQEFQLPYVMRKMRVMEKGNKLPQLPKNTVRPSIITGLEALGRGNDKNKLISFLSTLSQTLGAEVIQQFVNIPDAIKRLATSEGIDPEGLIKSQEEIQQEMQQQQLLQATQNIDPNQVQDLVSQVQEQQGVNE
jgi:hypothetical protein